MFKALTNFFSRKPTEDEFGWTQRVLNDGPVTIDHLPDAVGVELAIQIPDWLANQELSLIKSENLRYPPHKPKTPIVNPKLMILDHHELINKIRDALNLRHDAFETHILPVITRAASYIQLLPASQNHHHNGRGGLFFHSLEVGFYCVQTMRSKDIYEMADRVSNRTNTTVSKSSIKGPYLAAAFFAGFLHDIAKPFSDVIVTSAKDPNNERWNPIRESMLDWAIKTDTQEIFVTFVESRHQQHNHPSNISYALTAIVTRAVQDFLGDEISSELHSCLSGNDLTGELTKIMLACDRASTSRDRKRQNMPGEIALGVIPVERFIIDALKRIALTENVNAPGCKIWHSARGTFIILNQMIDQMKDILSQNNLGKISPQEIIDVMVSCGYFITASDGTPNWTIYPAVAKDAKLKCIKLSAPTIIFTGALPPETAIFLKPHSQEEDTHLIESITDVIEKNDFQLPVNDEELEKGLLEIRAELPPELVPELQDELHSDINSPPIIDKEKNAAEFMKTANQKPVKQNNSSNEVTKLTTFSLEIKEKIQERVSTPAAVGKIIDKPVAVQSTIAPNPIAQKSTSSQRTENQTSVSEYIAGINTPEDLTPKQQRRRNVSGSAASLLPSLDKVTVTAQSKKISIDTLLPTPPVQKKQSQKQSKNQSATSKLPLGVLDDFDLPIDLSGGEPVIGLPMSDFNNSPPQIESGDFNSYADYPELSADYGDDQINTYSTESILNTDIPGINEIDGSDVFQKMIAVTNEASIFYKMDSQILIPFPQAFNAIDFAPEQGFQLLVAGHLVSKKMITIRSNQFMQILPQTVTPTLLSDIVPKRIYLDSKLKKENQQVYEIWQNAAIEAKSVGMTQINDSNARYYKITILTPTLKNLLSEETVQILESYGYYKTPGNKKSDLLLVDEKYWH